MSIADDLRRDEAVRTHAYQDSLGFLTIGVGRLIDPRKKPLGGLREDEIALMLANDIKAAQDDCRKLFPAFNSFSQSRRDALTNLMFNLGIDKLSLFTHTVAAINAQDWVAAQNGLRNSLWFKQVGERGPRVINALGVA